MQCRKQGLVPHKIADLSSLRAVGSTGAPLPAEGYQWVYEAVGADLLLGSVSGGTDVCTGFFGSSRLLPVYAGELVCRCLGAAAKAFDTRGNEVLDEVGELVITEPMPTMPLSFWGDADGSRYRAAYFADFPGVWRHGDWVEIHSDGSAVIKGRSDATLNRGGVRLGTSEFYAIVEAMPEVEDSLVVHLEDAQGGVGRLMLFVQTRGGAALDERLAQRIRSELKTRLSPRHIPDQILAVAAIPRTLSGKKLEIPVKRILGGQDASAVASAGALANPEALAIFEQMRDGGRQ
jgi:acetoacetyl-CoA synthetase